MTKFILIMAALCSLTTAALAVDVTPLAANLDSADYDVRQSARLELRQTLVDASPRELRSMEATLLDHLGPDQSWATRDWTIRMLELIGTKRAVKPLAKLLDDPDARIRDLARRALSANPASAASSTLEKALLNATPEEQTGYLDALAYRSENRAVREIATVLKTGQDPAWSDAVLALGKINTRRARAVLRKAHANAAGDRRGQIEWAMLDAELTDRKFVRQLTGTGHTDAIKLAAFARLIELDDKMSGEVLDQVWLLPASWLRGAMIRVAAGSDLSDATVAQMASLSAAEQAIVLGAIIDGGLAQYEAPVLALLAEATDAQRPMIVRTLGHIGSEASYEPLLALHLKDSRDRDVTAALARLRAPSADENLLAAARGAGPATERIAALRLLVLRNTDGVTRLVNELGQSDRDPTIREAAFKAMEVVGDTKSVNLLLGVVMRGGDSQRQAQLSLKRLSRNLAVPDFLWADFYAPALTAASSDENRRGVVEILDGVSGEPAVAYIKKLIDDNTPLTAAAKGALQRWTDISAANLWFENASAPHATAADIADTKRALLRLLSADRITGSRQAKVLLAHQAIQTFPDQGFQESILRTFDGSMNWETRAQVRESFPDLLANPKIRSQVQAILDRSH